MKILIVDDSPDSQLLLQSILSDAGYMDLLIAESAVSAFKHLGMDNPATISTDIDLILMDIMMPDIDGIEACRLIKSFEYLRDTPIIIVTAATQMKDLHMAFAVGAIDYITKPVSRVELLARVRSALRLKHETDRRKVREQELLKVTHLLEEANQMLQRLSTVDVLTGIANRRRFDEVLEWEWKRAMRDKIPLSVVFIDIDFFKTYNDAYGHQAGDECLKRVARTLASKLRRSGDLMSRYGGEEFLALLSRTDSSGAAFVAEMMRTSVEALEIPHPNSQVSQLVTVSLGVATAVPKQNSSPAELIAAADEALYGAKHEGRNQVKVKTINESLSSRPQYKNHM